MFTNYALANMEEQNFMRITDDDISEANRLSLHCPICVSAVEDNPGVDTLTPILCAKCGTLYHKACWEQAGGKCAILGCEHDAYRLHGIDLGPVLKVDYKDIPQVSPNGHQSNARNRRLKAQQKREVEQLRRPSLLQRLWKWLLDQIKVG